jgi:hypothetical protein
MANALPPPPGSKSSHPVADGGGMDSSSISSIALQAWQQAEVQLSISAQQWLR